MSKNWIKILKNETSQELYNIYTGRSKHGLEAKEFAKKELENRNVDLNQVDKYKRKWELEKLIKENEEGKSFFGNISSSKHFLIMAVTGALIGMITIFDVFLEAGHHNQPEKYRFDELLLFGFSLIFMLYGFIMFKKEKKREAEKNKRIRELIEEL